MVNAEKFIKRNMKITISFLLIFLEITVISILLDAFPFPGLAIAVTLIGLLWSVCNFIFSMGSLKAALMAKLQKVWIISFLINVFACVIFSIWQWQSLSCSRRLRG